MDDVSYYSDDESVCLGLTFTHNTKVAQSSANSTDSGVECTQAYDKTVGELSNTCAELDLNPKCDTDSGCDVKPQLDPLFPQLSGAQRARMAKLGGVEGGKVATLNTRALDILNGKFDDTSQKCAQRSYPVSPDSRCDKRKCTKRSASPKKRDHTRNDKAIYENIPHYDPALTRNHVYVNCKPNKYNGRTKASASSLAPSSKHPSTPSSKPSKNNQSTKHVQSLNDCTVLYNTPVRHNYIARPRKLSPHHYEMIRSPKTSSSPTISSSPDPKQRTASPHEAAGTENTRHAAPNSAYDTYSHAEPPHPSETLRSYHEAMRSGCYESSRQHENLIYTTTSSVRDTKRDTINSTGSSEHMDYDMLMTNQYYDTYTTRCPRRRPEREEMMPDEQYERDEPDTCRHCNKYMVYNFCTHCTNPSAASSPEHTLGSGSSDVEYRSATPFYSNPQKHTNRRTNVQTERTKANSRFRYSISNIKSEESFSHEDTKRGVVLLQATSEDIYALHKLTEAIFELRCVDSGLTSEIIRQLGELCTDKHIHRLVLEDCEIDDWTQFSTVVNNTTLSHFGLHNCNIGDKGAVYVAHLINTTPTLTSVAMTSCKIKCAGMAAIGVALMQNSTLLSLNLSGNDFEAKGAVLFFRALKGGNSTLQHLSLADTCCGSTDVVVMIGALLLRDTPLQHLNLNNTRLSDDGVTLLAESIAHNTHLASLCIADNGLQDGSAHELAVTLADRNNLVHVDISRNAISRKALHVLVHSVTVRGRVTELDISGNNISTEECELLVSLIEDLALCGVVFV